MVVNLFSRKSKNDLENITPDFMPMIRIVFWNSFGFFFFWFLIPHVIWVLMEGSATELGFSFAGQTLGALISAPIVGYLTDKISKKLLVLIGSFGRGAAYLIMYIGIVSTSLSIFVVGLFTLGFFVGFFWSPLDALVSQKSHKAFRSSAFGKQAGMLGRGNLVGSMLAFLIFALTLTFTPNNPFLIYSPLILFTISNVYAGIIFNKNVDESLTYDDHITNINGKIENNNDLNQIELKEEDSKSRMSMVFLLGFLFLILAVMTSNINQTIAPPFFQLYIRDFINSNDIIIMLIYFPSQILSLLLAPKLGKFADRINPMIGIAIFSGLGSLVTWFFINSNNEITVSMILLLDSTFAWAGNLILQNVLSRISKGHRGKIFGLSRWMSFFGAIIGPIIGGMALDQIGFTAPFIISIFVELSVIPLYIIAIKLLKPYMAEKLD